MKLPVTLSFTEAQHKRLQHFLFPGDGKEAVAFLLCGRRAGDRRHRLVVREILEIPYEACSSRTDCQITWETDLLVPALERAAKEHFSVIKVHSHPGNYAAFSKADNSSDHNLLPMIRGWVEADIPHGSAVMLPDGQMFGRVWQGDSGFASLEVINIVG